MTNHEGHIKLWDELARTGGRNKVGAFKRIFKCDPPPAHCFACASATDGHTGRADCSNCPITWHGGEDSWCTDDDSPFDKWTGSIDRDERKRLAAIIRDLPWKERNHD